MLLVTDILVLFSLVPFVWSVPSWDGGFGTRPTSSIGSLVPGADFLEALGQVSYEQYRPKYLSIAAPKGVPGHAVIYENPSPPLFYVHNQQLWQVTNQTSVLRVNLVNVTTTHDLPLKLVLGAKEEGLTGGTWRWQGTMLHYEVGSRSNLGLYYSCQGKDGAHGVYTSLEPMPTPEGCRFQTLHSFIRR